MRESNRSQGPLSAPRPASTRPSDATPERAAKPDISVGSAQVSEVKRHTRNRQLLPLGTTACLSDILESLRRRVVLTHWPETLIGLAATERLLVRRSPHVARNHLVRPAKKPVRVLSHRGAEAGSHIIQGPDTPDKREETFRRETRAPEKTQACTF